MWETKDESQQPEGSYSQGITASESRGGNPNGEKMLVVWISIVLSLPNVKVNVATILICKMK